MFKIIKLAFSLFFFLSVTSCTDSKNGLKNIPVCAKEKTNVINIEKHNGLVFYFPKFNSIDFVCVNIPEKNDTSIIFCCSASFTGELLKTFNHRNIAGNHVSDGKYYRGFKCRHNTGCFTFYNGKWGFHFNSYNKYLRKAAANHGIGFGQNMIIYDNKTQPSFRKLSSINKYRALCEYKGKLCIVDSKFYVTYKRFISFLEDAGVRHALYLDMGKGWNHSWYRDNNGDMHEIHSRYHHYQTNWIVFRK